MVDRLSHQLNKSKECTYKDSNDNTLINSTNFKKNFLQKYFILTENGKPVFNSDEFHDSYRLSNKQFNLALKSKASLNSLKTASINSLRMGNLNELRHNDDENEEEFDYTSLIGVLTLVHNLINLENDEIKYIKSNNDLTIHFNKFDHLIYVYISNLKESNKIISQRLGLLHQQLLSIIPKYHIDNIFRTKPNYDLRQLVEGSEGLLKSFIIKLESNFNYNLMGIQPFKMDLKFRNLIGSMLLPPKHLKSHHLYTILFAYGKVVTIVRPKKHSIHPTGKVFKNTCYELLTVLTDLIIVLNTVTSSPSLRNCQSWLPISLPKFTSKGFLNAYIAFEGPSAQLKGELGLSNQPEIGVIHISGNPESFEDISDWWDETKKKLKENDVFDHIYKSANESAYSCGDVAVPGVRHFVFKNKANVQITCPTYDSPYAEDMHSRQRLLNSYDELYNRVRSTSATSGIGIPSSKSSDSLRSSAKDKDTIAESTSRSSVIGDRTSVIGDRSSTIDGAESVIDNNGTNADGDDNEDVTTSESARVNDLADQNTNTSEQTVQPEVADQQDERRVNDKDDTKQTDNQHDKNDTTVITKRNDKTLSKQLYQATITTPTNLLKTTTSMMGGLLTVPSIPQFGQRSTQSTRSTPQHVRQRSSYYIKNEYEGVLVWSTRIFELYIALPASMPHRAAINSAQSLVKWIRREEQSLFLGNTPTF